jgi:hypothetical protein
MGQSRLTADQLVAYVQAKSYLTFRAADTTLAQHAAMYVDEGNRYNVRGDVAFAQAILETGWFYYPDGGIVRPIDHNYAGIGACGTCGDGYTFPSPLAGVRAHLQLLRAYADPTVTTASIPDPPVPELWGLNPANAAYNFDHFFKKGVAPGWENFGNGTWAAAPDYSTTVLGIYNKMLAFNGLTP